MKVLFVSPKYPSVGGISTWMNIVINNNFFHNNLYDIVDTSIISKRRSVFDEVGVSLEEFKRTFLIFLNLMLKIIYFRPKIIHINSSVSKFGILRDLLCVFIAKTFRIIVVTHYHGNPLLLKKNHILFLSLLKLLSQNSDLNIFLDITHLSLFNEIIKRKSIILPNFIDDNLFHKMSFNRQFKNSKPIALYVGAITKQKGIFELIQIAKSNPDILFRVIGETMNDLSRFNDYPDNFKLYGLLKRSEVIYYMFDSDIFVFPSHSEGFPFVVLEALRCGLPIISTKVGCLHSVLNNKGSYLCEVSNVDQFNHYINILKSNTNRRREMSEYNTLYSHNFVYSNVMKRLCSLYQKLLSNV